MEIRSIYFNLAGKRDAPRLLSQNGVKYRTICSPCNSKIGSDYDPTLIDFIKIISVFLKSSLTLPPVTYIRIKPIRLFKAILAHSLSTKLNIDNAVLDERIRETILLTDAATPKNINIFYWIYPYDCTIILKDFAIPTTPGNFSDMTFCSLLKFFPVAFLITETEDFRGLDNLGKFKHLGVDEEADIRIDLTKVRSFDFPEKVDNNNIVFMSAESENAIFAQPRRKK